MSRSRSLVVPLEGADAVYYQMSRFGLMDKSKRGRRDRHISPQAPSSSGPLPPSAGPVGLSLIPVSVHSHFAGGGGGPHGDWDVEMASVALGESNKGVGGSVGSNKGLGGSSKGVGGSNKGLGGSNKGLGGSAIDVGGATKDANDQLGSKEDGDDQLRPVESLERTTQTLSVSRSSAALTSNKSRVAAD